MAHIHSAGTRVVHDKRIHLDEAVHAVPAVHLHADLVPVRLRLESELSLLERREGILLEGAVVNGIALLIHGIVDKFSSRVLQSHFLRH